MNYPEFYNYPYTGPCLSFGKLRHPLLGVWCWSLKNTVETVYDLSPESLLSFLVANRVTEIYMEVSSLLPYDSSQTERTFDGRVTEHGLRDFIGKCSEYGIRVAALDGVSGAGTIDWLDPSRGYPELHSLMDKVTGYNSRSSEKEKLYAIHLDVEPHTIEHWEEQRPMYLQQMADFAAVARTLCDQAGMELEYDLFGGFEETDTVLRDGKQTNIIDAMAQSCHAMTVMSYSRSAEGQWNFGCKRYLPYAKKYGSRLVVGGETMPVLDYVPPEITYRSIGKEAMLTEQNRLGDILAACGYENVGIAVHHTLTWYTLMTDKPLLKY